MLARVELPSTLDHPSPCIIYEFAHPLQAICARPCGNLLLLVPGYHETLHCRFDFRENCFTAEK